jgi:hypothetical protein
LAEVSRLVRKVGDMDKFMTKENIVIAVVVFAMIVQSNYFATKLDVSNLKNDMLKMELEMKKYTDSGDDKILTTLENKLQIISNKIDKLR